MIIMRGGYGDKRLQSAYITAQKRFCIRPEKNNGNSGICTPNGYAMSKPTYFIKRTTITPELNGLWDGPAWSHADILEISHFRPESSDHRPTTEVKLLYDDQVVYVIFKVNDQYVRCVHDNYLDLVCEDSCVEWFVKPLPDKGYFNFEINCGGTLHCSYIENPTRSSNGFKKFRYIPEESRKRVLIFHSMPTVIDPEIQDAVEWIIEYHVPLIVLEDCVGKLDSLAEKSWKANFYKCGDKTSHPHWAAWAPVRELNFHRPEDFGTIRFI
jgi:hypothetical protein